MREPYPHPSPSNMDLLNQGWAIIFPQGEADENFPQMRSRKYCGGPGQKFEIYSGYSFYFYL